MSAPKAWAVISSLLTQVTLFLEEGRLQWLGFASRRREESVRGPRGVPLIAGDGATKTPNCVTASGVIGLIRR